MWKHAPSFSPAPGGTSLRARTCAARRRRRPACSNGGASRAKRLVAGGERVPARQLLEWGVLDAVVPPDALMDTALEWAARYAAKPPIPAQMIKRSVNAIVDAADSAVMHMDVDQNLLAAMTEDRATAAAAWRARALGRDGDGDAAGPPVFKGD